MEARQARGWRMLRRPAGALDVRDFALDLRDLPPLADGQVLTETRYISLDPYLARMMRSWEGAGVGWSEGIVQGRLVAQVAVSRSPLFNNGDFVLGFGRWQERDVFEASALEKIDAGGAPPQSALGVLGASGLTAFVGLRLAEIRGGETVLISAATGAVGGVAGQLGRLAGCRVVGTAGGVEKCRHAVEGLGFDACIDHRAADFPRQLAEALPNGVDLLFENVGGPSLDPALPLMRRQGRIMLCGLAAHYQSEAPLVLANFKALLHRQITLRAFATADHADLFDEGLRVLRAGLASGRIRRDETIIDGLENAPAAYIDMLKGGGIGKRLIRLS